jgi:hypothetical protein
VFYLTLGRDEMSLWNWESKYHSFYLAFFENRMKTLSKTVLFVVYLVVLGLVLGRVSASKEFTPQSRQKQSFERSRPLKLVKVRKSNIRPACKSRVTLRQGTPIRVPAKVEVQKSIPHAVMAGEKTSIRLTFVFSRSIPHNSVLKLQMVGGRHNRVQGLHLAQTAWPEEDNYLSVKIESGAPVAVQPDQNRIGEYILEVPQSGFPRGTVLIATMGDKSSGSGGIQVLNERVMGKTFFLFMENPATLRGVWDVHSMGQIVGACTLDVLGAEIDHLRAYAPSSTIVGEPFEIVVRPEDRNSYLSHETLTHLKVFAEDRELKGSIHVVPDSTGVRFQTSIPSQGIYRLKVVDTKSGKKTTSNPTICTLPGSDKEKTYWGMIHGHSEMSDGTGSIDYYFKQMRDEAGLNFSASSEHDYCEYTTDEMWRMICDTVKRWNQPGSFVVLLGYEWAKWRRNGDGDRNVYYFEDDRPIYRSDDGFYPSPPDLFGALRGEKAMVIPHHTASGGNWCDWKDHYPEKERLVEIYQQRGSMECPVENGNTRPIRERSPVHFEGYVRRALTLGWRVGFTAGGDDHWGSAGTDRPMRRINRGRFTKIRYNPGLMSLRAKRLTRQAIWEEMWNRRIVATTGARMLLDFKLNKNPMGSELTLKESPELAKSRIISVEFHGTAPLKRIEIIRNNEVVKIFESSQYDFKSTWEDTASLDEILLKPTRFCPNRFSFYYIRAIQEDGEVAWASPIWIDDK